MPSALRCACLMLQLALPGWSEPQHAWLDFRCYCSQPPSRLRELCACLPTRTQPHGAAVPSSHRAVHLQTMRRSRMSGGCSPQHSVSPTDAAGLDHCPDRPHALFLLHLHVPLFSSPPCCELQLHFTSLKPAHRIMANLQVLLHKIGPDRIHALSIIAHLVAACRLGRCGPSGL